MGRRTGWTMIVVGALVLALPLLPPLDWLPEAPLSRAAVAAMFLGLVLIVFGRRAPKPKPQDPVEAALRAHGFGFVDEANGWRARGAWEGRTIEIRRVRGYEASRFGLEWVVELTVRGIPEDPWPLPPDQARIVDRRDHAVSIAFPSVSRPGGESGFAAAVEATLRHVAPEPFPR